MVREQIRALVVEDEPAHAEAIKRAFQTSGMKAALRVVGTLKEYRKIVSVQPPDIAILDMNLPDGRAIEVLTAPPEAGRFPIVVITAFGNEKIAVEVMKAGALDTW